MPVLAEYPAVSADNIALNILGLISNNGEYSSPTDGFLFHAKCLHCLEFLLSQYFEVCGFTFTWYSLRQENEIV